MVAFTHTDDTTPIAPLQIPEKIISGGQTGADYGALVAAKSMGIPTGGTAPRGFRTEKGSNPRLGSAFGLVQSDSREYPPRTKQNIIDADFTIIFSVVGAPERGSTLTKNLCKSLGKPYLMVPVDNTADLLEEQVMSMRAALSGYRIRVLNVAGNRESVSPGIQNWTIRAVRRLYVDE